MNHSNVHAVTAFFCSPFSEAAVLIPEIRIPRPPRDASIPLPDEYYSSVAYVGQFITEWVAMLAGKRLKEVTQSVNLCVAGGIGLNIDTNRKFLDEVGFEHIFIQPGASDTGVPLGCALWGYHVILGQPRFWTMQSASLGRKYRDDEILAAIATYGSKITVRKSDNIAQETTELIADGSIVGWFQGGAEYGPRALGNRSILCDARIPDMRNILNNRVKHREPWRPFAAAVPRECIHEYFELAEENSFMLLRGTGASGETDRSSLRSAR